MSEAERYDAIRQEVEHRFKRRYAFFTHIAVYTVVSIVLWVIYGLSANMTVYGVVPFWRFPWPLVVMAGWGIGLVAHGMNYYIRYGDGAIRRRQAVEREIEREMARQSRYEKPKNDSHMRLTDDGELEFTDDAEWAAQRKHR